MDESKIRKHIRTIILENRFPAYIKVPREEKALLYALCVDPNELDWLYEQKLMDKIIRYIVSDSDEDAILLAKEVKNALGDYYETHLESLFEDCLAAVEQELNEEGGLRRYVDPVNGEVTWRK